MSAIFRAQKLGLWIPLAISILCLLFWEFNPISQLQLRRISHHRVISKVQDSGSPLLISLRTEGLIQLPTKDVLKSMSATSLNKIYHSYLDNTDILCHRKLRMGKVGDGGWEICDDEEYRPKKPCLVYSFGINFDFTFDDDVTRLYQCPVFSFDPSMRMKTNQRTPLNMFLQIGIAGHNTVNERKWTLQTLSESKKMLTHTGRSIDVLKMDVELAEWDSLPQMIQSGEMSLVRQLLIEYHGQEMTYHHLAVLRDIYDLGFRKFYVHKNPACAFKPDSFPVNRTRCYEVHYVNINYSSD